MCRAAERDAAPRGQGNPASPAPFPSSATRLASLAGAAPTPDHAKEVTDDRRVMLAASGLLPPAVSRAASQADAGNPGPDNPTLLGSPVRKAW